MYGRVPHPQAFKMRVHSPHNFRRAGKPVCCHPAGPSPQACPGARGGRSPTSTIRTPILSTRPPRGWRHARHRDSIRAGLVFQLKHAFGTDVLRAMRPSSPGRRDLADQPSSHSGQRPADRLPSFPLCPPAQRTYLHPTRRLGLTTSSASIQGGCCAPALPPPARIDLDRSPASSMRSWLASARASIRLVRVSFNSFSSGAPSTTRERCSWLPRTVG